jgi:putative transposase
MPRKARLDAPGALHHIIVRGIERRKIFRDDEDRNNFLDRLEAVLKRTGTACYAWALIPNHFHLLLRSGDAPISQLMRCLLTGYAVGFNRRHHRCGHLFQNRYKSILCQEDSYLLELVRYIHLNPLRAKLVAGLSELDSFPYCGHSAVLNRHPRGWQDVDKILNRFGRKVFRAREAYRDFMAEGVEMGRRPELTGGGLVRSLGGWDEVKRQRKAGGWNKGDERILGGSEFVQSVLDASSERLERKYRLQTRGLDFEWLVVQVARQFGLGADQVLRKGRRPATVEARSVLCYWAHRELGISTVELAGRLELSQPAISLSVARGEEIAARKHLELSTSQPS